MRILLVEDETKVSSFVARGLMAERFAVDVAADGQAGLDLATTYHYDLIVLDLMLPKIDGTQVLRRIRSQNSNVPVLILTARDAVADKVGNFEAGADDYLTKPFGVDELMARVRATLRRAGSVPDSTLPAYRHAQLEVDFGARRVRVAGNAVSLTPKQYDVLAYLARNAGKVLTHRQILQAAWGGQYADEVDYVWTYVRRIRRRIEIDPAAPRFLLTEPGVGYRMPA